jgi:transposase
MNPPSSIPQHIWDSLTEEDRAVNGAAELEERLAEAEQQIHEFRARLDQNSTISSKPPSTDPKGVKRTPPSHCRGNAAAGRRDIRVG